MPKYLWQVSYSPEGTKGLLKDRGPNSRGVAEEAVTVGGGNLEAF